jgi:hypothetical protein
VAAPTFSSSLALVSGVMLRPVLGNVGQVAL